jgi:ribose/xylose/arabinose/galactoside ABC-type transport system permease subunit
LLVLLWMLEISALLGLIHGFLITELRLQPFLVTLCGLLIYRGLARRVTNDQTQGFGQSHELLRSLANGRPCSMSLLILLLGCLLCAWALWRWSRRRSDLPAHPQTAPWCLAVIGAAALLAGGLHYVQDLDGLGGVPASWSQQALFWLGGTGLLAGLIGWQVSSRGEKRSWAVLAGAAAAMLLTGLTPLDRVGVPAPLLIMIAVALLAGGFVNQTVWGRYLLALGNNEQAARFSGIPTKAMTVTAYVLCALAAGLAGILFSLDINSIQPLSLGNAYELYAIAAAVLGGCSLRGGEGSILGVVIGAAVMRVLYNAINILGISTQLEYAVIGSVILGGVIVDELLRRWEQQRRRTSET